MSPKRLGLVLVLPLTLNFLGCGEDETTTPSASPNRVWVEVTNLTSGSQGSNAVNAAPGDQLRADIKIHNAEDIRMVEIPITYTGPKCTIDNASFVGGAYEQSVTPTVDIDPGPKHVYFAAVPPTGTVVEGGDWLFASLFLHVERDALDGTIVLGTSTWTDCSLQRELNFFDPQDEAIEKPDFDSARITVVQPPIMACVEPNPYPPDIDLPDGGELQLWQAGNGTISGTETDVFTVFLDCDAGYGFAVGASPPHTSNADIVLTYQIGTWSYTDDEYGPGESEWGTITHFVWGDMLPIEMKLSVRSKGGVPTDFTIHCDGQSF
jgi:hypothetical protein